jgi:hypothetical protein
MSSFERNTSIVQKDTDMATLEELEQQKKQLEKEINEQAKKQRAEDLKLVKQLCKRHKFTYSMLKNHLSEGRKRKADK